MATQKMVYVSSDDYWGYAKSDFNTALNFYEYTWVVPKDLYNKMDEENQAQLYPCALFYVQGVTDNHNFLTLSVKVDSDDAKVVGMKGRKRKTISFNVGSAFSYKVGNLTMREAPPSSTSVEEIQKGVEDGSNSSDGSFIVSGFLTEPEQIAKAVGLQSEEKSAESPLEVPATPSEYEPANPQVNPTEESYSAEVTDSYPQSSAEVGGESSGRGVPVAYGSGSSQNLEPPVIVDDEYMSEYDQGYDDELDESLGERDGAERNFSQSRKSRRDESKGTEKYDDSRPYSSVGTMDAEQVGLPVIPDSYGNDSATEMSGRGVPVWYGSAEAKTGGTAANYIFDHDNELEEKLNELHDEKARLDEEIRRFRSYQKKMERDYIEEIDSRPRREAVVIDKETGERIYDLKSVHNSDNYRRFHDIIDEAQRKKYELQRQIEKIMSERRDLTQVYLGAETTDFYPQSSAEIGDEQSGYGVPVSYGSGSSQYLEPPVIVDEEMAAEYQHSRRGSGGRFRSKRDIRNEVFGETMENQMRGYWRTGIVGTNPVVGNDVARSNDNKRFNYFSKPAEYDENRRQWNKGPNFRQARKIAKGVAWERVEKLGLAAEAEEIVYSVHLETLDGDTVWGGEYYLDDYKTEKGLLDEAEFDLNYAEPAWKTATITKQRVGASSVNREVVKTIDYEAEEFGAESKFDKLADKIARQYENKGKTPEEARRIGAATAYKIGVNKYGRRGMAAKARAGRRKAHGAEGYSYQGTGGDIDIPVPAEAGEANPMEFAELGAYEVPVIPNTVGTDSAGGSGYGVPQWYGADTLGFESDFGASRMVDALEEGAPPALTKNKKVIGLVAALGLIGGAWMARNN